MATWMRAGSAPRAPRWDGAPPPRPPAIDVSRTITTIAHASVMPRRCFYLLLLSAHRHAHRSLPIRSHHFGVPRGNALGRGCRGRGRPLPPPAQGNCFSGEGARSPLAAARAGQLHRARMIYFPRVPNASSIARSTSSSGPGPPSQARNSTLPAGPVIGERARPCAASPPSAAAASDARSTAA
jgi:hypothetical protein